GKKLVAKRDLEIEVMKEVAVSAAPHMQWAGTLRYMDLRAPARCITCPANGNCSRKGRPSAARGQDRLGLHRRRDRATRRCTATMVGLELRHGLWSGFFCSSTFWHG